MGKERVEKVIKELLLGKKAIVTGGANGIGRAIVREFLKEGAEVLFFDIDEEGIASLEKEYPSGKLKGYRVDITQKDQVEEIFKSPDLVGIDILVNNAGGGEHYSTSNPDETAWKKVMDLNLEGARYVTEKVVSQMQRNQRKGSVVFITSVHTAQAFAGDAPYDAAKHALVGYMRVLALELGSYGIRSNAVAPGSIYHAGRTAELSPDEVEKLSKNVPLKRLGEPEDIAPVVAFIASDRASYMNGAEIRVDGGLSIKNSFIG